MDLDGLYPDEDCSKEIKLAMKSFRDNVTKSYTTSSRRWSIWSLVRDHVDQNLEEWIKNKGPTRIFSEERFSEFCKNRKHDEVDIQLSQRYRWYREKIPAEDIDALRNLNRFFLGLKPKSEPSYYFSKVRSRYYRKARKKPFCDLCWKKSQAEKEIESGKPFSMKSERFCEDHDPRDPSSLYRTDHNNKQAFIDNLNIVIRSGYYFNILAFEQREHARKIAYKMTKHHIKEKDIEVMNFLINKVPQSEIARRLGTSRQNIFKIKKKTDGFIKYWNEIRTSCYPINPEDLEIWEKVNDSSRGN